MVADASTTMSVKLRRALLLQPKAGRRRCQCRQARSCRREQAIRRRSSSQEPDRGSAPRQGRTRTLQMPRTQRTGTPVGYIEASLRPESPSCTCMTWCWSVLRHQNPRHRGWSGCWRRGREGPKKLRGHNLVTRGRSPTGLTRCAGLSRLGSGGHLLRLHGRGTSTTSTLRGEGR